VIYGEFPCLFEYLQLNLITLFYCVFVTGYIYLLYRNNIKWCMIRHKSFLMHFVFSAFFQQYLIHDISSNLNWNISKQSQMKKKKKNTTKWYTRLVFCSWMYKSVKWMTHWIICFTLNQCFEQICLVDSMTHSFRYWMNQCSELIVLIE